MDSPVLLVTDDPTLAPAMAGALKSREMDVVPCEPARCISMAAKAVPVLVLLDLEITTVGWESVLTALLMEARTRGVPVIGTTRTAGGEHVLAVVAGMHDVLTLPLDGERLEQLSTLLITLGFQFGSAGSEPGSAAADRLVLYAERSGVSGTLERGPISAPHGHATFSLGALTSCRFGGSTGRAGLAALLSAKGDVRFSSGTRPLQSAPAQPEIVDTSALEQIEPIGDAPRFSERLAVLAVDDDPEILSLVEAFLTKEGFDVSTATDGEEGFTAALALRPEAIVSDLEMPRLDGWGLLRKIRADHRLADTPFLFLSAAEDFRMSIQACAAGAQDYLSKSGARDALSSKLRGALAPRGCVIAADGFGVYEVAFENGELRSADATAGGKTVAGEAALEGFVAVRSGDLVIAHATRRPANLTGAVAETVEAAAARSNTVESLAVTRALTSTTGVVVDPDLCDLYARFGPVANREVAVGLRAGKSPLDLLASSKTPVDVEKALRDMARRRVILVSK